MQNEQDLKARLNSETAAIRWGELERHFARGVLITVDPQLDLVEVAAAMARDDAARVQAWLSEDRIRRTTSDEARSWAADNRELWCVVVAPWALVQERALRH